MNHSGSLMAALDKLVLERHDQRFFLREEPPEWFYRLGFGLHKPEQPIAIELLMPFLEAFLPDAEKVWLSGRTFLFNSDCWTETAPDGEEFHLEATALNFGGCPLLIVTRSDAVFFERRRVLQRARELSLAHDALARELERRDVLLHCIVHDLAAPLHSMLGSLSLLEERPLDAGSVELIRLASEAALHQRELIREILDIFAAEHRALDVRQDEFAMAPDLWDAVADVADALTPMASNRGVHLERRLDGPTNLSCKVIGEQRRLSRVLFNLLHNAVRFTPAGKSVRVFVDEEAAGARVTVEDEGPGVPLEVAPRLFHKFVRGWHPDSGIGLGLYFCRITIENWGGAIGYEPRPGGGSRFWLRLRRATQAIAKSGHVGGGDCGEIARRG